MAEQENATQADRQALTLAELARTGNARETCRIVGVARSTTSRWRKDRDFAMRWQATLAAYETQRVTALAKPPGKPTRLNGRLQRELLDLVAGAYSVTTAARAIGMDDTTVWALARRDVAFATALSAAVNHGYKQVEAQLISDCVHGIEPLADESRERVSDAIRARMVANGHKKAGAREAAANDEAERDRNEALAAKWVTRFLAELDDAA